MGLVFLIVSNLDNEDLDVTIHTTGQQLKFDIINLLCVDNKLE